MPEPLKDLFAQVAAATGFSQNLVEKDYWLTRILSRIADLSSSLVFKGGTCLNKIYFDYFRLSEDLDFIMLLPDGKINKTRRRNLMRPIKEKLPDFAASLGLTMENLDDAGRNECKQYVFYFQYPSVVISDFGEIKLEISLRANPIMNTVKMPVRHKFANPFTEEPLFDAGDIQCLQLNEAIAEKLRAAATRLEIAPRDFYDLDFLSRNDIQFNTPEIRELFIGKLKEDDKDEDITHYALNLGRNDAELVQLANSIKNELLPVLTPDEAKNFNLTKALARINQNIGYWR